MIKPCFPCNHDYRDFQSPSSPKGKAQGMTTGACGIDCTVCRLHVSGLCSTCGSGLSVAGKEKLAAQHRLFGQGCPVLECAVGRKIGYCLRDCESFPCDNFSEGPYPFSEGFLDMQKRRREKIKSEPIAAWPESTPQFWEELLNKEPSLVAEHSGSKLADDKSFQLICLNETWSVDVENKRIIKSEGEFGGNGIVSYPS